MHFPPANVMGLPMRGYDASGRTMTALSEATRFECHCCTGSKQGHCATQAGRTGRKRWKTIDERTRFDISRSGYRRKQSVDAAIERCGDSPGLLTPRERRLIAPLWSACLEGMEG